MTHDVNANDALAFFVEIGALIILGTWAWRAVAEPSWARLLTVVVVLGAAVVLWGLFASPQSAFDVPLLAIAVKVLVLGGSIGAAYLVASGPTLPTVWAVIVVVNTVLIDVGPFARSQQPS